MLVIPAIDLAGGRSRIVYWPGASTGVGAPTDRPERIVATLVEHTGFERSNAAAEVGWYTYRPTYPLSYLLGRTLLLTLRSDEQARLGDAFRLRDFHDALLRNGSLPISFQRRLLAGEGAGEDAGASAGTAYGDGGRG